MPIGEYLVGGTVNTGITFAQPYVEFSAAVAAGASLDELHRWFFDQDNPYQPAFKAMVLAWYKARSEIELHTEDAKAAELKKHTAKGRR